MIASVMCKKPRHHFPPDLNLSHLVIFSILLLLVCPGFGVDPALSPSGVLYCISVEKALLLRWTDHFLYHPL